MTLTAGADRLRNLVFFRTPSLWQVWPFLPVMRRRPGQEMECGLLYDAKTQSGLLGYSATVFVCNLFLLSPTLEEFLALPKEVYDTPDEVYDAG
jgi:hypothetical protein